MARRTSPIEDLLTLVARAPWPVGVGLAVVSFVGLRIFLHGQADPASDPTDFARALYGTVAVTLASIAQFILPAVFLIAALGSFLKQRRKSRIFQAASSEPTHGVAALSWLEFEELVSELFRRRGFEVSHTGRAGPDGGVDIKLRRGGETFLVQCKHWRARKVPVMTVRELYGAMTAAQAAGGFVVTAGAFTKDARAFAEGRNIELIDGAVLAGSLSEHRQVSSHSAERGPSLNQPVPDCPKCGALMVKRVAKQGPLAGNRFWGCSQFPQ